MSLINSFSNVIAKLPSSPKFDQMMSKVSNPGPGNVAPYIIPESAVITGRSTFSGIRDGWIEFQERFLEETTVAIAWFWGVTWLDKLYKKNWKKWAPGDKKYLDMDLDWGAKKPKGIELASFERYAFNRKEWTRFLKAKVGKLAFAVGGTLLTVAILIPWANQVKTDWLLKKFYQPKPVPEPAPNSLKNGQRSHGELENHPVSRLPEATPVVSNALPPSQNPAWISPGSNALSPSQNPAWFSPVSNALPPSQNPAWISPSYLPVGQPSHISPIPYSPYSQNTQQATNTTFLNAPSLIPTQAVRFGFSGGSAFQAIGHAIENTDVGRMLIIDTGITGGRAVIAGQRSPFESAEIVFRDVVSLYFYILCVPHVTRLLNKWVNPALAASILLDPAVAGKLTEKVLQDKALQQALKAGAVSAEQMDGLLNRIFYGISPESKAGKALADFPLEKIQSDLRTIRVQNQGGLLEKELSVLFNAKDAAGYRQKIMDYLGHPKNVSTNQVMQIIQEIEAGQGGFKGLEANVRKDMITGIKQAFGTHIGISAQDFTKVYDKLIQSLGDEAPAFTERLNAMARQDGRDVMNKMFRRAINVSRHLLGASNTFVHEAEYLSKYVEKATSHNLSLGKLLANEAHELQAELTRKNFSVTEAQQKVLERFRDKTPFQTGDIAQMDEMLRQIEAGPRSIRKVGQQLNHLKKTMVEGLSSEVMVQRQMERVLEKIELTLSQKGDEPARKAKELIQEYKQSVLSLFKPENRRLFSLAVDDLNRQAPELAQKTNELLHGGLINDSGFLKTALREINALDDDARTFVSKAKSDDMVGALKDYMETLRTHMKKNQASYSDRWTKEGLETFLNHFHRLSKNSRYMVRWVGLFAAMAGLGLFVPKFQNVLTAHLTGKDEHPGIAAARARLGLEPQGVGVQERGTSSMLSRNNFNAFKTGSLA